MSLPGISITINPNGLRQLAASGANLSVKLGISTLGTANTLYQFADAATAIATLGVGPLAEAVVDTLALAGQVAAVPLTVTGAGSVTNGAHVGGGAGTVVPSVTSPATSANDAYVGLVTIVGAGALGAALFTYSMDGGNNTSGQILVPAGGVYAIPGTNVTLTFASTFVVGDTYAFTTTAAVYTTASVTSAFTALLADPTEWGYAHVVGQGANAAAAATMAGVVDTQMALAQAAFRYVFGVIECPTSEADSALISAFQSFVSDRTMVCAGDIGHVSAVNGWVIRRNCATVVTSRLALIPAKEHPGKVQRGPVKNVKSLYRNEAATPALDAQRFTTLRTFVKKQGYFVTRGNMMAVNGSDYSNVMNRRVMDIACTYAYSSLLTVLNDTVPVDKATGYIYPPAAAATERLVRSDILGGLNGNARDVSVTVSKTEAILSTKRYPVDIGVLPFGYAEQIVTTIGFVNPALAA
jgi:hypothetical protein